MRDCKFCKKKKTKVQRLRFLNSLNSNNVHNQGFFFRSKFRFDFINLLRIAKDNCCQFPLLHTIYKISVGWILLTGYSQFFENRGLTKCFTKKKTKKNV